MAIAETRVTPMMIGMSTLWMACQASCPIPGQAKTDSTTTTPPMKIPISRLIIATMGRIAFVPVSSLDVSIQSQVLNLLLELRRDLNLTYVFISHDLAVVQHLADTVAVMHLGEVVEMASASEIFNNPKHPYTQALISAVPQIDLDLRRERIVLRGDIPNPQKPPTGCHFHPRCPQAMSICSQEAPTPLLLEVPGVALGVHTVTCHLYTPGREE